MQSFHPVELRYTRPRGYVIPLPWRWKRYLAGSAEKSRLPGLVITRFLWAPRPPLVAHNLSSPYLPGETGSPTDLRCSGTFPRSTAMQCVPGRAYRGDAGAGDAQGGSGVWRPESGDSFSKWHSVRKCQNRPAALHGDLS